VIHRAIAAERTDRLEPAARPAAVVGYRVSVVAELAGITASDVRYGGHLAGTIRANLQLVGSDPPVTGTFTSSFQAAIPE